MSGRIDFLKGTDLFADAPDDVLAEIDDRLVEISLAPGAVLFREGETSDAAYFVQEGALSLQKEGVHLVTRPEGECVGEFALIDDAPRSASAVAEKDVRLLKWTRQDFQTSFPHSIDVMVGIVRILTRKLREDMTAQVEVGLEMKLAREIQEAMLPEEDVSMAHLELSGHCRPAADVAGDYYDYLPLGGDRVGLILGDVTGHGLHSGLLVAMAKSCVHTQVDVDCAPETLMRAMNRILSLSICSGNLMTCCYILVDTPRRSLTYTNAGHPPALHYCRREDELTLLGATGLPLGMPESILKSTGPVDTWFKSRTRPWEKGDLLLIYSDGITEAEDACGEMFEAERLQDVFLEHRDQPPASIKGAILEAMSRHCGSVAQTDDVTLIVGRAV